MGPEQLARKISDVPGIEETGLKLSRYVHRAVLKGGRPARKIADLLHGTWLGHPLHPILTDITVGAWALGALFDAIAAIRGSRYAERVADTLAETGTISSIGTLLTGLTDYSAVQKAAISPATIHALLNDVNVALYLLSVRDRRNGNRNRGVFFSTLAITLAVVSAWLGGHLVYSHKVGVDHSQKYAGPKDWTPVLNESDLEENKPEAVEVDGNKVLLFRCNGSIHAIDAVCSHAGGPLEEGTFTDCTVQCPWHDSVFDLRTGSIVHGPTTHPLASMITRVRDGQIEIRMKHQT